jgi:type IV pilus assembly protein PilM
MAKSASVWGIEIGQSALKALRCSVNNGEVVASAFDFIEYPKILSQPDADPEAMISEALEQLASRNDSLNEKICISIPGQSGLAKFFKPPPVELKKVGDIVRYEARQQIPFDLDDVVWDYQTMPGSMIEEGFALESEVGLFAMKREMAYRQLAPFDKANIEVDVVQMAPLALYNTVAYDRMHELIDADMFDPANPPPSTVVLSIGTDSSDLIITNGFRIWQRSMPIGGNHFTRQLAKDLKLTFANAEHLKRNAREAADPKLVFQTMRPVFNDLVTEIQRSIGFFRSLDKKAQVKDMLITGNTVKMPGLSAYIAKNLGFEVHVMDDFKRLGGEDVMSIPTFKENIPTFAVCYGLCLQGLGLSQVTASLVPKEIKTARMIRAKKPWALAGIAALLMGMAGHYAFTQRSWAQTLPSVGWGESETAVKAMSDYSTAQTSQDSELSAKLIYLNKLGEEVSGSAENRLLWLEVLQAINNAFPRTEWPNGKIPSHREVPLEERIDIHFTDLESKHYDDLATWWTPVVAQRYREEMANWTLVTKKTLAVDPATDPGPTGPGWVFQLHGYHYFNNPEKYKGLEGSMHVRKYLTTNFLTKPVVLPDLDGNKIEYTSAEIGLSYPLLLDEDKWYKTNIPNPEFDPEANAALIAEGVVPSSATVGLGQPAAPGQPAASAVAAGKTLEPPTLEVRRLDFVYQIVWQEKVLSARLAAKKAAEEAAEAGTPPADDAAPAEAPLTGDVASNP